MFTIGQFAQLGQVSVRTLHHYEKVGLLRPSTVDRLNGYRSYAAAQLADLNRILVLKDLGLTLAEIGRMIEAGVTNEELVGMLRLRQEEAVARADEEQARLTRAAARIDLLAEHPDLAEVEAAIVVKPLGAMRIAAVHQEIDDYDRDFMVLLPPMFKTLSEETVRVGIRPPIGPLMTITRNRDDGRVDVYAAIPVEPDQEIDSDLVETQDLPAVERAATIVYVGHPHQGRRSLELLGRWMQLTTSPMDHYREIYLNNAQGPPEQWVLEMQTVLVGDEPAGA